jgi:hypothetical protein
MQKLTDKSEEPDWLQILFEHTHRQGNIAGFQMIVSFFVLGFVWSKDTPWGAAFIMLGVYFFCAIYLTNTLYRIQDRRITLWRYIAKNSLEKIPDDDRKLPTIWGMIKEFFRHYKKSDKEDEIDKESHAGILRENYIKKLNPAPKYTVLVLHTIASIFALIFILFAAVYKLYIFYKPS